MNERDAESMPLVDAETLAALIDGRLDPEERARVLEQIARSEDDYATYLEAVHAAGALQSQSPAAAPPEATDAAALNLASARRRRFRIYGGLAAAAALAALVTTTTVLVQRDDYPPGVLLAQLDPGVIRTPGWDQPPWRTVRAGDDTALNERQLAFRLGVRLAHLEAAERSTDPDAIRAAAAEVAGLAEQLPGGSAYAALYRDLQNLPPDDERRDELRRSGWQAMEEALPGAELKLGAWTGAARLALLAGDVGWFDTAAARTTRERIPASELEPATRQAWEAALAALAETRVELLRERLDALARVAGG